MTCTEKDAVDEGPFFGFDPFIVFVIIGVVEERVEGCSEMKWSRRDQ